MIHMRSDLTVIKHWFIIYVYYNILIVKIYIALIIPVLRFIFVIMTGKIISFFSPISQKNLNRMVNATNAKTLYKDINKKYVK